MRFPARIYEPRWSAVKSHCETMEFTVKVGMKEETIKVMPTRRGTALLVTAGVALILAAALYEALV